MPSRAARGLGVEFGKRVLCEAGSAQELRVLLGVLLTEDGLLAGWVELARLCQELRIDPQAAFARRTAWLRKSGPRVLGPAVLRYS